ncbi:MAG TPA: MFS transporter [Azospirillaceae bacterium]|nr:MFS transporter [Azospirillaceae bacterium]
MSGTIPPADAPAEPPAEPLREAPHSRGRVVTILGIGQILAWGSTYYLPAVLAPAMAADTGWPLAWIVGGFSLALLAGGLMAASVGRWIERFGGRPVLAAGTGLIVVGLAGLAWSPSLPVYIAAWLVTGLGMAAGLYDAAFSTLGRLYGRDARSAITNLTLFGGFASTVCWPLSAVMLDAFGWRGVCLGYAAVHLAVVLPAYLCALPREPAHRPVSGATRDDDGARPHPGLFVLVAAGLTLGSAISSVVSVHLLTILQARDIALAAAVALGAVVGPSQVAARMVEKLAGERYHPVWTVIVSNLLVTAGLGLLFAGLPLLSACLVLYGAGIGIKSIARGTLPLALFGPRGYAETMGRLAMPNLIVQAASPSIGALLLEGVGADGTLAALTAASAVTVALSLALLPAVYGRAFARG